MLSAEDILNDTITGSNATSYTPIPRGEYPAMIEKTEYRTMPRKDNPALNSHILDITYIIDDATAREVTGLEKPTVRQSVFLDMTEVDGKAKLDMSKNKNVGLGRLRDALGLNDPDKPFSFKMLTGLGCFVTVVHNPGKNPNDVFANVDKVGKSPTAVAA